MLLLTIIFCLTTIANAIGIVLPLYVYPGTKAAAWSVVNKAIATYSKVQWQIIINPNSGPDTTIAEPYPNDDFIVGIKTLNKYPNVQLLGYVDTLWGRRSIEDVKSDIDKYAAWAGYNNGEIAMDGIFFDDVPSIYDFHNTQKLQVSNETYFQNITSYASATIPTEITPIMCNSGNPGVASFFDYCDTMVEFENTYASYNGQTMNSLVSNGGVMKQSAIIINSVPKSLALANVKSSIKAMKSKNVAWLGLANDCCYKVLNGTLLTAIAAACNDDDDHINVSMGTRTNLGQVGSLLFITLLITLSTI